MKTQHDSRSSNLNKSSIQQSTIHKPFSKRSKVMKSSKFFNVAASVLVLLALLSVTIFAQGNLTNTGTWTNTGTLRVNNFTNSGSGTFANSGGSAAIWLSGALTNPTANNFDVRTGITRFKGLGGTQTVATNVHSATYDQLQLTGSSHNLAGTITAGTVFADSAGVLATNGNTLIVTGTSPFSLGSNLSPSFNFTSGTVEYANPTVGQTVYGTTYNSLDLQSNGTALAGGNVAFTGTGTLTVAASTTFDLSANTLTTVAGTSFSNGNIIQTSGSVTLASTPSINGTFKYQAASSTQDVGSAHYTNLTLENGSGVAGTKRFPASVHVKGSYSSSGGDRDYATNFNVFHYDGTAAQTLQAGAGEGYYDLTVEGGVAIGDTAVHKTANAALTVNHNLVVSANSSLDMSTFAISTLGNAGGSSVAGKILYAGSNGFALAGGGYTEFYGGGAANIANGAYSSLVLTGSGTKTLAGVSTTATYTLVSSNLTVGATGVFTVTGNFDNNGTLTNDGSITVN
jgi:hypothetical protein